MSNQITTAMVQQYRANVEFLLQQRGSILRPFVREVPIDSEFMYFDRIGATSAVENTGRHQDTPLVHTPHDRRRVSIRDFDWADLIDKKDKIRTLIDPTSEYAMNAAWALGRSIDDIIIEAFFGTAQTGKTGSGSQAWDTANLIADTYSESTSIGPSVGLTIAKLRRARTLIRQNLVDKSEPLYIACSAVQIQDLLATTEVTSHDYNTVRALVNGEIDTFMGFKFVEIERLDSATSIRDCPVWAHSGMLLAIGQDIQAEIDRLPGKRYSVQVYCSASFGAVRMEEDKVLKIQCAE